MVDVLERSRQDAVAAAPATAPQERSGFRGTRYLEPGEFCLREREDGVLDLLLTEPDAAGTRLARYEGLRVYRLLPLTAPTQYISLRVGHPKEVELGIIRDLDRLDSGTRAIIERALARRYLMYTILRIRDMKEEFGFLTWDVETDQGRRQFTMPRWDQARVQEFGPDGMSRMVYDVYWNRYVIRSLDKLDSRSRKLFQRYIYW